MVTCNNYANNGIVLYAVYIQLNVHNVKYNYQLNVYLENIFYIQSK